MGISISHSEYALCFYHNYWEVSGMNEKGAKKMRV